MITQLAGSLILGIAALQIAPDFVISATIIDLPLVILYGAGRGLEAILPLVRPTIRRAF